MPPSSGNRGTHTKMHNPVTWFKPSKDCPATAAGTTSCPLSHTKSNLPMPCTMMVHMQDMPKQALGAANTMWPAALPHNHWHCQSSIHCDASTGACKRRPWRIALDVATACAAPNLVDKHTIINSLCPQLTQTKAGAAGCRRHTASMSCLLAGATAATTSDS